MASHDLTLKNYQKQLKDNIKLIYDNYIDLLRTKTEHVMFEVQVKSAEIVRSYQSLMQLVAEIRSFLIINDLVTINQPAPSNQLNTGPSGSSQQSNQPHQMSGSQPAQLNGPQTNSDEKLVKLRDEMSMFLYELEIPLP